MSSNLEKSAVATRLEKVGFPQQYETINYRGKNVKNINT